MPIDSNMGMAIGSGFGTLGKALAMGNIYGQKAQADAMLKQAMMDKYGAEAERDRAALAMQNDPLENSMLSLGLPTALAPAFRQKIQTGNWGPEYAAPVDGVGPVQEAPATEDTVKSLARLMSITQRMYGTGSKVNQGTDAALDEQKMRFIEQIANNPNAASDIGRAYAATGGKSLYESVGNTGHSLDNFTGKQSMENKALAILFANEKNSMIYENNAQAKNALASAELSDARRRNLAGEPQVIQNEDGSTTIIPGGKEPKPMTEGQSKSLVYGSRMLESDKLMTDFEKSGVTSSGYVKNAITGAVRVVSDGAANATDSVLRLATSENQKRLEQAQRDFLGAVLRRESGALISPVEFANGSRQYFPQVGDTEAVIAQKRQNRELATQQILADVPRSNAYKPRQDDGQLPQPAPQPMQPRPAPFPQAQRDAERMSILQREMQAAKLRLDQARASGDPDATNRALADVAALNREMGIKEQPAPAAPASWGGEGRRAAPAAGGGWGIRRLD